MTGVQTCALPIYIHPVWTPTEASWLNLIEAQFGVLKKFTVDNTDDASHEQRQQRVLHKLEPH